MKAPLKHKSTIRPFVGFDTSMTAVTLPASVIKSYAHAGERDPKDVARIISILETSPPGRDLPGPRAKCGLCGIPLGGGFVRQVETIGRIYEWADGSEHYVRDHQLWSPSLLGLISAADGAAVGRTP